MESNIIEFLFEKSEKNCDPPMKLASGSLLS